VDGVDGVDGGGRAGAGGASGAGRGRAGAGGRRRGRAGADQHSSLGPSRSSTAESFSISGKDSSFGPFIAFEGRILLDFRERSAPPPSRLRRGPNPSRPVRTGRWVTIQTGHMGNRARSRPPIVGEVGPAAARPTLVHRESPGARARNRHPTDHLREDSARRFRGVGSRSGRNDGAASGILPVLGHPAPLVALRIDHGRYAPRHPSRRPRVEAARGLQAQRLVGSLFV
jgi:hypothetical protein